MLPTRLEGARTHNLAGVDLTLRPGELVVVTGVSGAGKSSLAMDTLYAEGQRRFVESFSPYARQFLERLKRPPMSRGGHGGQQILGVGMGGVGQQLTHRSLFHDPSRIHHHGGITPLRNHPQIMGNE